MHGISTPHNLGGHHICSSKKALAFGRQLVVHRRVLTLVIVLSGGSRLVNGRRHAGTGLTPRCHIFVPVLAATPLLLCGCLVLLQ